MIFLLVVLTSSVAATQISILRTLRTMPTIADLQNSQGETLAAINAAAQRVVDQLASPIPQDVIDAEAAAKAAADAIAPVA